MIIGGLIGLIFLFMVTAYLFLPTFSWGFYDIPIIILAIGTILVWSVYKLRLSRWCAETLNELRNYAIPDFSNGLTITKVHPDISRLALLMKMMFSL